MDETPASLFRKSALALAVGFGVGMAAILYFIINGHQGWALFWWSLTFSGVLSGGYVCWAVIKATAIGAPRVAFETAIVGPASLFLFTLIAAFGLSLLG